MCGIAGWIDWTEDLTHQRMCLEGMAETLDHRGPDEKGYWLSSHAALAHRRLIVIDPQGGTQPMIYTVGDYTYGIVYNGELYNFRELRSELEVRGHAFHTQSDTEVLLHTYLEWEEDCVQHLNGIFAFGLWDGKKQQLLLARDHLGVKPLFYAQRGSAFLFASELKALLAHPLVKAEVDQEGLTEILKPGPAVTPGNAAYYGVYALRPAHILICTYESTRFIQYWTLRSAPHTDNLSVTIEHLRALLEDTVRRQMIADVPLVTLLSGGLDSSGLTALAAREMKQEGKTLQAYAIDFVDSAQHFHSNPFRPDLDIPWAQQVSDYLESKLDTVIVDTPEMIENLLVPLYARDLPGNGQIETSLYLLFKAIKKTCNGCLIGRSSR
jgi:asparagine synthase (glutamine-hydrolysing)